MVFLMRDVTDLKRLELQLLQAQKLESIGQLAAGIAHEINTPTQFVGDNTLFLKSAFEDLSPILSGLRAALANPALDAGPDGIWSELRAACEKVDFDFVMQEVPRAIEESISGLGRVSSIVGAMKEFSHPGVTRTMVDINHALKSTATVARNEWKYLAELDYDLQSDLPQISCSAGEINQVFLNIIVNGAHAIAKANDDRGKTPGKLTVRTRSEAGGVVISIGDNGCGMPDEVRQRIFDPFFTTKGVGKGTGQGLTIAHTVVHKQHGGRIDVESKVGVGTTFHIHLPFASPAEVGVENAAA